MRLLSLLPLLVSTSRLVSALRPPIPEVQAVVASALDSASAEVNYAGPTGSDAVVASSAAKHPQPAATPHVDAAAAASTYWLENVKHSGLAPYNANPSTYAVFRNVMDYGAKGDGVTDDTAAINAAISAGSRCVPGSCKSSTASPAVVYFPAGTYLISKSIVPYYFTQLIGNPNSLPVLKATAGFSGFGLVDADPYQSNGAEAYGSTNVFYRQVRNLVFDMTGIPSGSQATGIHWPTSQATSLQNLVFKMSSNSGTQHTGVFIEDGSGGFLNDLVFYGGLQAVSWGNQQFTIRNLTINNAVTGIFQIWDWGFTYSGITINNCTTGVNMASGGSSGQTVGTITFIDSSFTNVNTAFLTARNATSSPATAGSLILENVSLTNVGTAVQGPQGTLLAGGTKTITGWGQGHEYTPNGPSSFAGAITPFTRPASLVTNGRYYARSKPQYGSVSATNVISIRSAGAKGDGVTDDTSAINSALSSAAKNGQLVYFDHGIYKVTGNIFIPAGSKIVGESYPVIMGSGSAFSSISSPAPVVSVGRSGDSGVVEWSDMIVSTQGAAPGAILIEWNLASPSSSPSGMWDVHTRVGGFKGSNLQVGNCPTTPNQSNVVNQNCIAAFMSMHLSTSSTGLYMENNWFWTADHDIDDPNLTQVTIFAGRGLYSSSSSGVFWLVGTAVEHHTFYQYQFASTTNTYAGQIQTETAYYQPNPNAASPFPIVSGWNDPDFATSCNGVSGNCENGWGLRIIGSSNILIYGAGLYSFFDNYSTTCSDQNGPENCQSRIVSLEGTISNVDIYNLNTIGATSMLTKNGASMASYADNESVFPQQIALFKSN